MTVPRILIVDDDMDFAESLAEALEMFGHEVEFRFTGEAGIEAAAAGTFDVILMDIGLPGLNGVESMTEIRRADPDAICFLLTGYSATDVSQRGLDAGAVEVLTKPIDPEGLSRRLLQMKNPG